MRIPGGFLFSSDVSVFSLRTSQAQKALQEVDDYDENLILSVPTDDLLGKLISKYSFDFPELDDENTHVEEKEIKRDRSTAGYNIFNDTVGGSSVLTQNVVIFHVPFTGDGSLLMVAPSTRSVPGPAAEIVKSELIFSITTDNQSEEQIKLAFNLRIAEIKKHINQVKQDLANVNVYFVEHARQKIEERKTRLLKSKNLVASLGFPMKRRLDAPATFVAPAIRRKIAPIRSTQRLRSDRNRHSKRPNIKTYLTSWTT